MARRLLLRPAVGERLLTTKLQILSGVGTRRPSLALSILTGRVAHTEGLDAPHEPLKLVPVPQRMHARTVYLAERHLRDIDRIIQACGGQLNTCAAPSTPILPSPCWRTSSPCPTS